MLRIKIPKSFEEERIYALDVLLTSLLGINYKVEKAQEIDYTIILPNDKKIIIKDHFFSRFNDGLEYLKIQNIPTKVDLIQNEFTFESNIPCIYGTEEFSVTKDEVILGIDIFASTFFMCTRWEEYADDQRDMHNRFPASASLALKFNFLHRPIVNEYAEMLWNILEKLEYNFPRKKNSFEIVFTHDIDLLSSPVKIKDFIKDIIIRKSIGAFIKRIGYLIRKQNPFDTFDAFMDVSEQWGVKSRFYFMTGHNVKGKDGEDYNESFFFKNVLIKIKERGHIIGFHPSFNSYNNGQIFNAEKNILEEKSQSKIKEGRQHVLRFEVPATWQLWEDAGLEVDSTMGYSAHEGFRCGIGNSYPIFNFLTRKKLKLEERPLIVMDTTLHVNKKNNLTESLNILRKYVAIGKKYNMPITFLFHNNIFDEIDWKGWKKLYLSNSLEF